MADQPVPTRQGAIDADGHAIHYEYFGAGGREAVCLLNGLAMHTKAWYSFLPLLQPEFDVLLYDYPGQGESSARSGATRSSPCGSVSKTGTRAASIP
jgi:pimeloyl-ACP methyl ester carboxylesterase